MYVPDIYRGDAAQCIGIMRSYPLGTLTVHGPSGMRSAHVPFVCKVSAEGEITLHGHVARENHVLDWLFAREVLVHFHGPQSYVSPAWYSHRLHYPTWVFAVVHVYGCARPIDREGLYTHLQELIAQQEGTSWSIGLMPEQLTSHLQEMILGFVITAGRVEGCFRLNQNKPEQDVRVLADSLRTSAYNPHRALAALIEEHYARSNREQVAQATEKYRVG